MFPEAVRDRLLNDDDEKDKKKTKGAHFMNTGEADKTSAPIADFYPDTTILFADLVGFTVSLMVVADGVWTLHRTTASISLTFPPFFHHRLGVVSASLFKFSPCKFFLESYTNHVFATLASI